MVAAACAACQPTPLPPDRAEYVGLWVAEDRYMSIFGNGRLEYKKKLKMGMHNRVQSNFEFEGDEIDAFLRSWVIDQPPQEVNGQLMLVLDGITYVHRGPPIVYGKSNNWPDGVR